MAKLVLSSEGEIIDEFSMENDIFTIGRQSDNDIQIESTSVSSYHTRLVRIGHEIFLEDLNSTNGTYVNSDKVSKCILENNDVVTTGTHHLKVTEHNPEAEEAEEMLQADAPCLRVIEGEKSDARISLNGGITTLGNPGEHVAAVTRRSDGYYFLHVDGGDNRIETLLNGKKVNADGAALKEHDVLEVAGTKMEFIA